MVKVINNPYLKYLMEKLFFSVIIPAHNEEKYIQRTLNKIKKLNYPKDKFEVIVVENGSRDKTFKNVKCFENKNVKVYSIKRRGISIAKNYGASKAKKKSDWIIFCDADTLLGKNTLLDINNYISVKKNLAIGTIRILPIEKSKRASFWFWFYNFVNKFYTGSSMCVQIARKKFFDKVKYDENLKLLEDFKLINDLKKYGKFFFIDKRGVYASARRVLKEGGFYLAMKWFFASKIPYKLRTKENYSVVR